MTHKPATEAARKAAREELAACNQELGIQAFWPVS
jgi:hypothetical protein